MNSYCSFLAAYILMSAVRGKPHLSSYALPLVDVAEQLHERIKSEFAHLSPIVAEDLEILENYSNYAMNVDITGSGGGWLCQVIAQGWSTDNHYECLNTNISESLKVREGKHKYSLAYWIDIVKLPLTESLTT